MAIMTSETPRLAARQFVTVTAKPIGVTAKPMGGLGDLSGLIVMSLNYFTQGGFAAKPDSQGRIYADPYAQAVSTNKLNTRWYLRPWAQSGALWYHAADFAAPPISGDMALVWLPRGHEYYEYKGSWQAGIVPLLVGDFHEDSAFGKTDPPSSLGSMIDTERPLYKISDETFGELDVFIYSASKFLTMFPQFNVAAAKAIKLLKPKFTPFASKVSAEVAAAAAAAAKKAAEVAAAVAAKAAKEAVVTATKAAKEAAIVTAQAAEEAAAVATKAVEEATAVAAQAAESSPWPWVAGGVSLLGLAWVLFGKRG